MSVLLFLMILSMLLIRLLYLSPHPIEQLIVNGKKKDNLLYHVVVQFIFAEGCTAIGIMNRDSGTNEEKVEVFTQKKSESYTTLRIPLYLKDKNEIKVGVNDWESTLNKRGFEGIVDEFLRVVESGGAANITRIIC